jgi:hypothetical protein
LGKHAGPQRIRAAIRARDGAEAAAEIITDFIVGDRSRRTIGTG